LDFDKSDFSLRGVKNASILAEGLQEKLMGLGFPILGVGKYMKHVANAYYLGAI
jgi:hypothetical protein